MMERDVTFLEVENAIRDGSVRPNKDYPGGKSYFDSGSGLTVHTDASGTVRTITKRQ